MSIYTTRKGLNNSKLFVKDKALIKKTEVPANIYDQLINADIGTVIDDAEVKVVEAPLKLCIFCKQPTKLTRFVNLQTVYLCEEHYHDKTIGQVAQQIRENGN